jgi:hypothetical protein
MERIYFNLSEEEFTKGRKILIWVVAVMFLVGGIYVALLSPVFGKHSVNPVLSLPPLGIGLIIAAVAALATIKRKGLYFLIDDEKVEFCYGLLCSVRKSFRWSDIKRLIIPHRERKAELIFKDSTSYVIDLTYLQRKKASLIRKHLFQSARIKNIEIFKVITLARRGKSKPSESS